MVTDGEVFPNLLKKTRRIILEVSGDGAYDTRACHAATKIKGPVRLFPQERGGILGARAPSQFISRLLEALRLQQELEKTLWLPQAFAL